MIDANALIGALPRMLSGDELMRALKVMPEYDPSVCDRDEAIRLMACLRKFPGVTHIQILIHPQQKRMIIRPCDPDAPDSLRWAKGGGEKELSNRDTYWTGPRDAVFPLKKPVMRWILPLPIGMGWKRELPTNIRVVGG